MSVGGGRDSATVADGVFRTSERSLYQRRSAVFPGLRRQPGHLFKFKIGGFEVDGRGMERPLEFFRSLFDGGTVELRAPARSLREKRRVQFWTAAV